MAGGCGRLDLDVVLTAIAENAKGQTVRSLQLILLLFIDDDFIFASVLSIACSTPNQVTGSERSHGTFLYRATAGPGGFSLA